MTLALTIDEPRWRAHLKLFCDGLEGSLIPVIKGNGYGFGRRTLIDEAGRLGAAQVAVGTIHELPRTLAPDGPTFLVLTPTLDALAEEVDPSVVLTVGSVAQLSHLRDAGFGGRVVIKLATSMQRYGCTPDELRRLDADPVGYAIHPPLAGGDKAHRDEIDAWLGHLDPAVAIQVSHLSREGFDDLRSDHPTRHFELRSGTALWHGDKSALRLSADVIDVRTVRGGDRAGYRQVEITTSGSVAMIGAGTSHGIAPLADGRSPFHFAQTRLDLLEPPHMHTSMVVVPAGAPVPMPGNVVDVQRPLIQSWVDRVVWIR